MVEATWIVTGIVAVAIVVIAALFLWGVKHALKLLLNSLIGFFALWLVKTLVLAELVINLWSVLLTAVFGIFGFLLVIILHFVGVF